MNGNWNDVRPIREGDGNRLQPGGYVIRIMQVKDRPAKNDLEIEYDIAEGEKAGYYKELSDRFGFWGGRFYASYGERARGFFRGFLDEIQESNQRQIIRPDGSVEEQDLVGCLIGIVLGREEYIGNDGTIKKRLYRVKTCTVSDIRGGKYTVPEDKPYIPKGSAPAPAPTQATGVGGVVDMSGSAAVMADPAAAFEQIDEEVPF